MTLYLFLNQSQTFKINKSSFIELRLFQETFKTSVDKLSGYFRRHYVCETK